MNNNGSGYFVGPPVEAVERAAAQGATKPGPPPPQVPGGERDPPPGTKDGYFVGKPVVMKVNPEPPAPPPPPPAASARKNKPSFLAKWVPCLFGGGASSEE